MSCVVIRIINSRERLGQLLEDPPGVGIFPSSRTGTFSLCTLLFGYTALE
jgi:hypothetical protein